MLLATSTKIMFYKTSTKASFKSSDDISLSRLSNKIKKSLKIEKNVFFQAISLKKHLKQNIV